MSVGPARRICTDPESGTSATSQATAAEILGWSSTILGLTLRVEHGVSPLLTYNPGFLVGGMNMGETKSKDMPTGGIH